MANQNWGQSDVTKRSPEDEAVFLAELSSNLGLDRGDIERVAHVIVEKNRH
jgi:hypothetical protein